MVRVISSDNLTADAASVLRQVHLNFTLPAARGDDLPRSELQIRPSCAV
jgi:hypothetical protein